MTILSSATASAAAGPITTATLVMIGIGMLCAIAVIAWGVARRRAKAHEVADSEAHAVLAGHEPGPAVTPGAAAETPAGVLADPTAALEPVGEAAHASPPPTPIDEAAAGDAMPLTMLKGLGAKAAARLGELGISDVAQLAALSPAEAVAIDQQMGSFAGRMTRDRWLEQAALLAAGDIERFEAAFGKLGG